MYIVRINMYIVRIKSASLIKEKPFESLKWIWWLHSVLEGSNALSVRKTVFQSPGADTNL